MSDTKRDDNELRREWVESRSREDLRKTLTWVQTDEDTWLAEGNALWQATGRDGPEADTKVWAEKCEAEFPVHEVKPADGSPPVSWLVKDMDCPPIDPQPKETPEQLAGRCPDCGSADAPIFWKPLQNSMSWWDDPSGHWACSMCQKDLLCPDWEMARTRARGEDD